MLSEKARLQQEVYETRNTLWSNVQKLQSQGYQVKEVKMGAMGAMERATDLRIIDVLH